MVNFPQPVKTRYFLKSAHRFGWTVPCAPITQHV
jgi:hypothetical protein